jgi:hypothetical protein
MFDELTRDVAEARASAAAAAERLDAAALSGTEAVQLLSALGTVRRLVDGLVARVAKRVDDTAAHTRGTDRSAAELTARVVGVSAGEARRAIDTAARLEHLPETDAAVRAGTLSAQAAELVAGAADGHPEAEQELLAAARRGAVPLRDTVVAVRARREDGRARRARQQRARFHRMWTTTDGMVAGAYQLPPEEGAAVRARIEADTRRIFRARRKSGAHEAQEAYAADALVAAVTGDVGVAGDAADGLAQPPAEERPDGKAPRVRGGTVGYTVHVVVDHDALTRGEARAGETCEIPGVGPVDVEWVRERIGEAFVTAIVKHGLDVRTVAHFGRHIPAELQTALIVGGRECVVEGCSGRAYLEVDHSEIDFAEGGPTALWNLDWECWTHHRLKSQGWELGPPDPITGKRRLDPPSPGRAA